MARIRTIKPEFWSDEKLSECSLSARLLFIGLISHSDDAGRMEHSPARLRMQIFPCGTVKHQQFSEWFRELTEHSLIRIYTVDSKQYIDIPNFLKHQKINRPTPSKFPEYSVTPQGALIDGSGSGSGMEWNGSKDKTGPAAEAAPGKPRKIAKARCQIPEGNWLTDADRAFASERCPDMDIDATFDDFRNHHAAKGTLGADWHAGWRTWIGNCVKGFAYVRRIRKPVEKAERTYSPAEWRELQAKKRAEAGGDAGAVHPAVARTAG